MPTRSGIAPDTPPDDETADEGSGADHGRLPLVHAAGVLCWRIGPDGLEVLLIHRPRYDDWSFPKGKLESGELLPECAVRELVEETGVIGVLGRPLPTVRYIDPKGAFKEVSYWAGRPVRTGPQLAPTTEVDRSAWLPVSAARELLSQPSDVVPLDALIAFAADGELDTTPVLVIRHGTARPRDAWARADADRPLIASGRRQSLALRGLIACWGPEYVISSPWRRCVDTLAPYAAAHGVKVRTKGGLSERGFRRDGAKARRHIQELLDRGRSAALCTHRPVLSGVFRALRERTPRALVTLIPHEDPYLAPGEVLVAHIVHRPSRLAAVVAIERHLAPR